MAGYSSIHGFVEDRKAISANMGYDACQQPSSCVLSSGHLHHPSDKHPDHSAAMLSKQHVQVWASRPCVSRTSSDKFGKLACVFVLKSVPGETAIRQKSEVCIIAQRQTIFSSVQTCCVILASIAGVTRNAL